MGRHAKRNRSAVSQMARGNWVDPVRTNQRGLAGGQIPGRNEPSVRAQRSVAFWITLGGTKYTSDGAGLCQFVNSPSLSGSGDVVDYQDTWDEYRVLAIQWHVMAVGQNTGNGLFYVDDADTTLPTKAEAEQKYDKVLPFNSSNWSSTKKFDWKAQSLTDLDYVSTASSSAKTYAALKCYSDATNYGSAATTAEITVVPSMYVEFRGVGGA